MAEINKLFRFTLKENYLEVNPVSIDEPNNEILNEYIEDNFTMNSSLALKFLKDESNISFKENRLCCIKFKKRSPKEIVLNSLIHEENVATRNSIFSEENIKPSMKRLYYKNSEKIKISNLDIRPGNLLDITIIGLSCEDYEVLKTYDIVEVNGFCLENISFIVLPSNLLVVESQLALNKLQKVNSFRIHGLLNKIKEYSQPIFSQVFKQRLNFLDREVIVVIGQNTLRVCQLINSYYSVVSESNEKFRDNAKIHIKSQETNISKQNILTSNVYDNSVEQRANNSFKKRPVNHITRQDNPTPKDYKEYLKDVPKQNCNIEFSDQNVLSLLQENCKLKLSSRNVDNEQILITISLAKDIYEQIKPKIDYYKKHYKLRFIIKPSKENRVNLQVSLPISLKEEVLEGIDLQVGHITLSSKEFNCEEKEDYPSLNYFINKCKFKSVNKIEIDDDQFSLTLVGSTFNLQKFRLLVRAHQHKLKNSNEEKIKTSKLLKYIEFN